MDSRKRWLVPCLAALMLMVGASSAQAAKSLYPPDPNARTLDAGPAGYVGTTRTEGLCVPILLCPTVTNSYQPSGGVNNSGYLRTAFGPSIAGVGATSIGIYTSPSFTYNGVEGQEAETLEFIFARRANVAAILQVTGNSATVSVDLVATSGGASVNVINNETLAGQTDFAEKTVPLATEALAIGQSYQIRITTRVTSGVQVVPSGFADYDNIRLRAKAKLGGGGNGGGGGGGGGNGGGGGGNGGGGGKANDGRFDGNGVIAGPAKLRGDRLLVRVRCNKKPKGRCKLQLQGLLKKRGPVVTNRRTVRVRPGQKRRIALDVRGGPNGRVVAALKARKRVVIKQTVRKGGKVTTGFVRVKVKLA